jgi:hypothetical protein
MPMKIKPNKMNRNLYATRPALTWKNLWMKYGKTVNMFSGKMKSATGATPATTDEKVKIKF